MAGGSYGGGDVEEMRGLTCDLQSPCSISVTVESVLLASFVLFEFVDHFLALLPSLALTLIF